MDFKKAFIEQLQEGHFKRALAMALDRMAMHPEDEDSRACLGLAYALNEMWRPARMLMEEILKEDPENEVNLVTTMILNDPAEPAVDRALRGLDGLKITSRWRVVLEKARSGDALIKMSYLMVTDPSVRVRADFMENVAPWFHEKAREQEDREATNEGDGKSKSKNAVERKYPWDFEP